MIARTVIPAFLLYSVAYVIGIDSNCPYQFQQNCVCETTFTICRDRKSYTSPIIGPWITPPTIDLNVAELLSGGVLPANLTEIYLHDSPITTVSDDAFDSSSSTVITLSITNCRLTKIPNAVKNLHALIYLTITDTNIQDWNNDVMTSIGPNIVTFFISNVGLNTWPTWMQSFTNVTEFNFEGSSLTSIPDGAFDNMNHVESLSLDSNKLSAVPKALSRVTTLLTLSIDKNVVTDITWLPGSSMLSSLSLAGNQLTNSDDLSKALLPFSNSLTSLVVRANQLTSIPDLDFLTEADSLDLSYNRLNNVYAGTSPDKLYTLDLSWNQFRSIPNIVSTLQFVSTLSLSYNSVTAIKDTDFASCIIYVQLDNNLISQLTDTSFPQNSGILSLILDFNPLTTISPSAFINLSHLTYLSLRSSHLARLPLALASLKTLNAFDISGSRDLVCTCLEKSLKQWVALFTAVSMTGDCGQTSVYSFFMVLSPGCP